MVTFLAPTQFAIRDAMAVQVPGMIPALKEMHVADYVPEPI